MLIGGDGNDSFTDGDPDDAPSPDRYEGGGGDDRLAFTGRRRGLRLDLAAGTSADGDVIAGIEGVTGGEGDDVLAGTDGPDELGGGPGDDVIVGRGGDDALGGGPGADGLDGGPGDDRIEGGSGADSVAGDCGVDDGPRLRFTLPLHPGRSATGLAYELRVFVPPPRHAPLRVRLELLDGQGRLVASSRPVTLQAGENARPIRVRLKHGVVVPRRAIGWRIRVRAWRYATGGVITLPTRP